MYTNKSQNSNWNYALTEDPDNGDQQNDPQLDGIGGGLVQAAVGMLKTIGDRSSAQSQLHPGPKHKFRPDVQALYFSNKLGLTQEKKSVLGMECYSTTLIYLLQSYGLVDPNIKRWEFEEKYTPITVGSTLSIDNANESGNKISGTRNVTKDNYTSFNKTYNPDNKIIYKDGMDVFTYRYKQFHDQAQNINSSDPEVAKAAQAAKARLGGVDYKTAAWRAAKGYESLPGVIKTTADVDYYLTAFAEMKNRDSKTGLEKFNKTVDLTDRNDKTTAILNTGEVMKYLRQGNTIYAGIYDSHQSSNRSDLFRKNASEPQSSRPKMTHRVLFVDYFGTLSFTMQDNSKEIFTLFIAEDSYYGKSLIADHKLPPSSLIKSYSVKGGAETTFAYTDYWPYTFAQDQGYNTLHIFSTDAFAASQPGD